MQTKCGLICKCVLELVQRQPSFKMLQSNTFIVVNALCRVCNQKCVEMCACFVYIYNLYYLYSLRLDFTQVLECRCCWLWQAFHALLNFLNVSTRGTFRSNTDMAAKL